MKNEHYKFTKYILPLIFGSMGFGLEVGGMIFIDSIKTTDWIMLIIFGLVTIISTHNLLQRMNK